jgi:hypothetical protein
MKRRSLVKHRPKMSLSSDQVCFFRDCVRHQSAGDESPGWLADDVSRRLADWFESRGFVEAEALVGVFAVGGDREDRERFTREVDEVRRFTVSLPTQPWVDNERQQAAVRFWLKRLSEPRVPTLRVRVGGQRGRFADPVAALAEHVGKVRWVGGGFTAQCPAHEDRSPSLSVSRGSDGRMLLYCFAGCSVDDVLAAVGWKPVDMFVAT